MALLSLVQLRAVAKNRAPGYLSAALRKGVIDGDRLRLSRESLMQLRSDWPPLGGAGTELTHLLSLLGIRAGRNKCACARHAREMDDAGPAWCLHHLPTILGWLRVEADRARLPFFSPGAALLVLSAVTFAALKHHFRAHASRAQPHFTSNR